MGGDRNKLTSGGAGGGTGVGATGTTQIGVAYSSNTGKKPKKGKKIGSKLQS